ncbi:MAG TPA: hypothetical protein VMK31_01660 [Sphingomicrobium sp.]|nr:hypothetical protein [Sphingomicrobium sp.]
MVKAGQPHLFLDCDGVLADFDKGARRILGMTPAAFEERHGRAEFWKRLARTRNFYGDLELMPDAQKLFDAVRHLKPTILTGLPLGKWAAPQKELWAAEHFPGVPIITTLARKKHLHMEAGDVLVDDRENHRGLWEEAGGIFVHHKNAANTIRRLADIYPSVKPDEGPKARS